MMGVARQRSPDWMAALIRKLVKVAPRSLIVYSSSWSESPFQCCIGRWLPDPDTIGAAAFLAVGRHPVAALQQALVVSLRRSWQNLVPTLTDAMLFEITNEAIGLVGGTSTSITADYFFQAASAIMLTVVIGFVIVHVVEPRLANMTRRMQANLNRLMRLTKSTRVGGPRIALAGLAFLVVIGVVLFATLPPGALRDPETGR